MFYLWLVQEAALDFRLVLVTEFLSVPTAVLLLRLQRQKASGGADGLDGLTKERMALSR